MVNRQAVMAALESVIDPCSMAAGAPAGLVSMGLVGDVDIRTGGGGADVRVTLFLTEPGCMMSALFQITATQKLEELDGVRQAQVEIDHGHVWGPEQMEPGYRASIGRVSTLPTPAHAAA